jgi:Spy/CpxP family protein refolding chaperone
LVLGAVLILLVAVPAAGEKRPVVKPVAHEELSRTLDELAAQLHDLSSRWRDHFVRREPLAERPLISIMLSHRDDLGLSSDQVQALERLRWEFQQAAIRYESDIRLAEMDIRRLLETDPVNLGQVEPKIRELERLRGDLRLARIRTIEQGKAQLTADQRSKLQSLLGDHRGPQLRTGTPTRPGSERF